jgi:phosphoribosylformylglycinamidine synthase
VSVGSCATSSRSAPGRSPCSTPALGEPTSERSRYLFEGAVAGIAHYGNSIGVPTVGGEVYFEPSYEHNCLVNAMCVGLAKTDAMIRAAAAGPGNLVVIMGASTGRDGIGGASVLASAELEAGDDSKRPSVQIGDPFEESSCSSAAWNCSSAGCSSPSRTLARPGSPPRPERWRRRAASGST